MEQSKHAEIVNALARFVAEIRKIIQYLYRAVLLDPENLSSLLEAISRL